MTKPATPTHLNTPLSVIPGRRVLITGVHGFTGHYLAQALRAAGYTVFGVTGPHTGGNSSSPDELGVDLTDRSAVAAAVEWAAPDYVVHLAAIAFVDHNDAAQMYRTNIIGTRNLLEALSRRKPRAVLLASSANVYGNSLVEPITEQVAPAPANDYAVSKLAMEHMARLWFDRLPITLVRPFNYTGIGQSENFLLPKIVAHYRRRATSIELGNLDVARDFSDVRDVVRVYQALLETNLPGETFNICSGQTYTLSDALTLMAEIAGYAIEVKVNPQFVRANEVKRLVGSDAHLRHYLGKNLGENLGKIPRIALRDTLRWMWQAKA